MAFALALGVGAAGIAAWSPRRWRASTGDGAYLVWITALVAIASGPEGTLAALVAALGVWALTAWRLAALRRRKT
ncbi:MAG: hypothetical protein ABIO70_23740 [Pseudomonadota bacterium]